jgi:hypothetical protein
MLGNGWNRHLQRPREVSQGQLAECKASQHCAPCRVSKRREFYTEGVRHIYTICYIYPTVYIDGGSLVNTEMTADAGRVLGNKADVVQHISSLEFCIFRRATKAAQCNEERSMPKFVTIGYGDQAGYDRTPRDARDMAHAHDASVRRMGALIGIAGRPVRVRNTDALSVEIEDGAYMASSLPLAGFAVIEAEDLEEAIEIVSKMPCAVAHGVIEVWPLLDD